MERIELERLPSSHEVYGRGIVGSLLITSRSKGALEVDDLDLPDIELHYRPRRANPERLAAYNELIGGDGVGPMFPHVMATPLIAALVSQPGFPMPLAALVHVGSDIRQAGPIDPSAQLDFTVFADDLTPHDVGAAFDITAVACVDGQEIWREVAHYVCNTVVVPGSAGMSLRQYHGKVGEALAHTDSVPTIAIDPAETWKLAADEGRKYAAVSHDRNKMHLSSLSAKAFGFQRAVAHGPYTAARAFALLDPPEGPFTWEARFVKPVLLPSTVDVVTWHAGDTQGYRGSDAKTGVTLFSGTVAPA